MTRGAIKLATERTADILGMAIKPDTMSIAHLYSAPSPVGGVYLPLEMRYSHGNAARAKNSLINCWKVSGSLYVAVIVGLNYSQAHVVLLDKSKWTGSRNFTSAFNLASMRGKADTLGQYLQLFKPCIIGVWSKGFSLESPYCKEDLESLCGEALDMDEFQT